MPFSISTEMPRQVGALLACHLLSIQIDPSINLLSRFYSNSYWIDLFIGENQLNLL